MPAEGSDVDRVDRDDPKYLRSALELSLQVEHSEMGAAIARMEEAYGEQHRAEAALSQERARAAEAEATFRGQLEDEQTHSADLRRRCASAVAAACAASLGVRQARDELAAVEAAAAAREEAARSEPGPNDCDGEEPPVTFSSSAQAVSEGEAEQATGAGPKLYSPTLFRRILRDGSAALQGAEQSSAATAPQRRQPFLFRELR